jgi:hypothetical protein
LRGDQERRIAVTDANSIGSAAQKPHVNREDIATSTAVGYRAPIIRGKQRARENRPL